jgi:hypothetical protein
MGEPDHTDVAVIGAGPYGLSLAAHLSARGVRFRIFGRAMQTWRANMPEGMYLKSPGRGSNLAEPAGKHTLETFCALNGEEYRDWDLPVPVDVFARYGEWFQRSLVPMLESQDVLTCHREWSGFRLRLEGGDAVVAKSVVVSNGYRHSARVPDELLSLPPRLMSHSSAHHSFEQFKGKSVIVVGAGQSALESATLLKESGASPLLVARCEALEWNRFPTPPRTTYEKLRHPRKAIGTGLRYAFYEHPFLPFYYLPSSIRQQHVDTVLGPCGAWWLRERFDQIPVKLGWTLRGARPTSGEVALQLERSGETAELRADHVIAATGYRVSPASFPFLSRGIQEALRWEDGWPALSRRFESTARGLHFIGFASARYFGPVMRFVAGAHATAPRLADHLTGRHNA